VGNVGLRVDGRAVVVAVALVGVDVGFDVVGNKVGLFVGDDVVGEFVGVLDGVLVGREVLGAFVGRDVG